MRALSLGASLEAAGRETLPALEAELGKAELQAAWGDALLCSRTIRDHHAVTFSSKVILGAGWLVSAGAGWAGEKCRRLSCRRPARQRVRQSCLLC